MPKEGAITQIPSPSEKFSSILNFVWEVYALYICHISTTTVLYIGSLSVLCYVQMVFFPIVKHLTQILGLSPNMVSQMGR